MILTFTFAHNNLNVLDLDKSIDFYQKALGLKEARRVEASDGSYILAFLIDGQGGHQLELTWLRDRSDPYNLGDNEIHLAFTTDDFDSAFNFHKKMDCVCFENQKMGVYFISDPDGYWLEIVPKKD